MRLWDGLLWLHRKWSPVDPIFDSWATAGTNSTLEVGLHSERSKRTAHTCLESHYDAVLQSGYVPIQQHHHLRTMWQEFFQPSWNKIPKGRKWETEKERKGSTFNPLLFCGGDRRYFLFPFVSPPIDPFDHFPGPDQVSCILRSTAYEALAATTMLPGTSCRWLAWLVASERRRSIGGRLRCIHWVGKRTRK